MGERRVLMAVTLVVDEGANLMPMRLSPDSPRTEVVWDEVSTLKYVAVLKSGNKVTGNFTCVHDATTDAHSLELCVALTFHPHGWIRFQRSHLSLNREDVLRLHIPLSVCEENMFRNALALPDIERLYGMSLADRTNAANGGDDDGGRKVATYRELPWAMRRRRDGGQNMPMPTLERVRQDTLRAESRYVSEVLGTRMERAPGYVGGLAAAKPGAHTRDHPALACLTNVSEPAAPRDMGTLHGGYPV